MYVLYIMYIVHVCVYIYCTIMYSKQFSLCHIVSHCTVDGYHFTSTLLLNVPVLDLQLNGVNSEYNVIHIYICMYTFIPSVQYTPVYSECLTREHQLFTFHS